MCTSQGFSSLVDDKSALVGQKKLNVYENKVKWSFASHRLERHDRPAADHQTGFHRWLNAGLARRASVRHCEFLARPEMFFALTLYVVFNEFVSAALLQCASAYHSLFNLKMSAAAFCPHFLFNFY